MPTFRQRPLTWLFWIAAACLDAVALATDREAPWVDALTSGQILVVGAWLAVGKSHRLARAAISLAAIGALTLPDFFATESPLPGIEFIIWPMTLGAVTAIAVLTATMVWGWCMLGRCVFGIVAPRQRPRWQFPLVEIFGWMNVVAIAAIGVSRAEFSYLAETPRGELAAAIAFLAATSLVIALTLGDFRRSTWPKGVGEIAWAVLLIIVLAADSAGGLNNALGACLFVGAWALTQKLDNQRHDNRAEPELRVV